MKVAVIGATGVVGRKMTEILSERSFPISTLIPVASERSVGQFIGADKIVTVKDALGMKPDIALFSAGSDISREWAPRFAEAGCRVIDNSSCWRMDRSAELVLGCSPTGHRRAWCRLGCQQGEPERFQLHHALLRRLARAVAVLLLGSPLSRGHAGNAQTHRQGWRPEEIPGIQIQGGDGQ